MRQSAVILGQIYYNRCLQSTIPFGLGDDSVVGDDLAVIDPQLRVHGLEGIRVVDAPTIIIAEKAADMIKAAHSREKTCSEK